MKKSYNDIKAQEQRVLLLCQERGRYCDNAKKRVDTQRIAQITRRTLTQHGFPIFGNFDKDERRPYIFRENPSLELKKSEEPEQIKAQQPTPTEYAHERIAFNDWMSADAENRKKDTRRLPPRFCQKNVCRITDRYGNLQTGRVGCFGVSTNAETSPTGMFSETRAIKTI